jgi:cell division transport system permease protein
MPIFLTKLNYLLRETWVGIVRGGWMNWAAISTVAVLLFLFGISLQVSWQIEHLLSQFGNQLELSVYLETGVDALTLQPVVAAFPEVAAVQTVTKEQAWQTLVQDLGDAQLQDALAHLGGNPLVDELHVKAMDASLVSQLAHKLQDLAGVENVQYVAEVVQRMAQLHTGLTWLSVGMTGLLTLGAIAIIMTTIRLIAIARKPELEIMHLVGATPSWIYFPFVFQGLGCGLAGAWVAWLLLQVLQRFMAQILGHQSDLLQLFTSSAPPSLQSVLALPMILLGFGASIGVVGSLLAVRRITQLP